MGYGMLAPKKLQTETMSGANRILRSRGTNAFNSPPLTVQNREVADGPDVWGKKEEGDPVSTSTVHIVRSISTLMKGEGWRESGVGATPPISLNVCMVDDNSWPSRRKLRDTRTALFLLRAAGFPAYLEMVLPYAWDSSS